MDDIGTMAGRMLAAFLLEAAAGSAGPVTEWLRQRLGTRKATEQLAADANDADSRTKLKRSIQQELETHPELESELRQRFASQIANAGSGSINIQIFGDNNTVQP